MTSCTATHTPTSRPGPPEPFNERTRLRLAISEARRKQAARAAMMERRVLRTQR
jgi:hypothetical protein